MSTTAFNSSSSSTTSSVGLHICRPLQHLFNVHVLRSYCCVCFVCKDRLNNLLAVTTAATLLVVAACKISKLSSRIWCTHERMKLEYIQRQVRTASQVHESSVARSQFGDMMRGRSHTEVHML
jgi:hypothetical protein